MDDDAPSALLTLLLPLSALAQPGPRQWRVGFLSAGFAQQGTGGWEAFRTALKELGYLEGQHSVLSSRFADGRLDVIPRLAAELIINLAAAKRLGLTIPPSLLPRVDHVVE
jgi:hypothetical protein